METKKKGNPNWGKKKSEQPTVGTTTSTTNTITNGTDTSNLLLDSLNEDKKDILEETSNFIGDAIEKQSEVKTENTEPVKNMSPEQAQIQEMRTQIAEMQKMMRQGYQQPAMVFKQEDKPFGVYDASNVPEDDYMEVAKKYVKFGKGYVLSVYFKNGKEVKAPFNKEIYFQKMFDEVVYQDNNAKVIPFCMYQTNSKAEAKFIEESPLYGVLIHNDYKKAASIDSEISDKVEQAILSIQRLKDTELMAAATGYGIDLRQSKDRLKAQLTQIKMKELVGQEKTITDTRRDEIQKQLFSPPAE